MSWTRFLFTYLKSYKTGLIGLSGVLGLEIALQLGGPYVIKLFIDALLAKAEGKVLLILAGTYAGVGLATQLVTVAAQALGQRIGWRAANDVRFDLFRHGLGLDMVAHTHRPPGEWVERIDGDAESLGSFLSGFLVQIIANVALLLCVLALLASILPWLGALLALYLVLAFGGLRILNHWNIPAWKRVRESATDFFSYLEERLAGAEDIRSLGATHWVLFGMGPRLEALVASLRRGNVFSHATWAVTSGASALGAATALGIGGYQVAVGSMTLGTLYLALHYSRLLMRPIDGIKNEVQHWQKATASISRIVALFQERSALTSGNRALPPRGSWSWAFKEVDFAYPSGPPVLKSASLKLQAGEVLGVRGPTGGGKSTLARLLFRFYEPTGGELLLDGHPLGAYPLVSYRERLAWVTQEVQIFDGTLRENLSLYDKGHTDANLEKSLASLGLKDWLSGLPEGVETRLGTGAYGLSAGEAQLLALARAFLKDPELVILDEVTSRLDPITEARVALALERLLQGRTGLVIAHRPATLNLCHRMVEVDEGHIASVSSSDVENPESPGTLPRRVPTRGLVT